MSLSENRFDVAGYIDREGIGRGKLPEAISFRSRLARIEVRLNCLSAYFYRVIPECDHAAHNPSFFKSSMRCSQTQSIP